jgi:hypothetical protein
MRDLLLRYVVNLHAHPFQPAIEMTRPGKSGDPQSAPVVIDRLNDSAAQVRQAAAHALGRLKCWQTAPAVARLLEDPVWTVRQEAALALRSFGAPGILLLRRSLANPDRFAGDMARYVLDLHAMRAKAEPA